MHKALFEVLYEHKSLLIKVTCSENDLNKHNPEMKLRMGTGEARRGIRERVPEHGGGL